ncbi:Cyclin-D-binding Myb-like transcription factor 1 [Frankliniella fusca]|uniref:Cyclin-D-binding Myb-like transcription factor 1 n=1 Tax=Frankliniella fusca TaxID=407009 RepID=A0AAE1HQ17_9NEOP|nr:Cyclin-D-binding Myb-like transcription factor 1 [Frankliniella fusca]
MSSMEELDVEEHCRSQKSRYGQWDQSGKMEAKLNLLDSDRLHKVRRLLSLDCNDDHIWAQQLLEQLMPQLEEVQLWNVRRCHLMCLENMPRLRKLQVEGWHEELDADPFIFKQRDASVNGIEFLHELELFVGLKLRLNGRQWICKDLSKRLGSCGLNNLSGLVLRRGDEREGFHPADRCEAQVKGLKSRLPWDKSLAFFGV